MESCKKTGSGYNCDNGTSNYDDNVDKDACIDAGLSSTISCSC